MAEKETLAFLLENAEDFELDSDDEITIAAILCSMHNQYVMDYKKYPRFDVEKYSNDEFVKQFRFEKSNIDKLAQHLGLNGKLVYSNHVM